MFIMEDKKLIYKISDGVKLYNIEQIQECKDHIVYTLTDECLKAGISIRLNNEKEYKYLNIAFKLFPKYERKSFLWWKFDKKITFKEYQLDEWYEEAKEKNTTIEKIIIEKLNINKSVFVECTNELKIIIEKLIYVMTKK